jgi:hypothetical protein
MDTQRLEEGLGEEKGPEVKKEEERHEKRGIL